MVTNLRCSILLWPEVQLTSDLLWKLKTKISQHVNTSRTSRHNPQINRASRRNIFNGNSCLVLLLIRFPASWKLLIRLPAFEFCFDYLCTTSTYFLWDFFYRPKLREILSKPCIISPVTKLGRQNHHEPDYSSISAIDDVHCEGWKIYSGMPRRVSDRPLS